MGCFGVLLFAFGLAILAFLEFDHFYKFNLKKLMNFIRHKGDGSSMGNSGVAPPLFILKSKTRIARKMRFPRSLFLHLSYVIILEIMWLV